MNLPLLFTQIPKPRTHTQRNSTRHDRVRGVRSEDTPDVHDANVAEAPCARAGWLADGPCVTGCRGGSLTLLLTCTRSRWLTNGPADRKLCGNPSSITELATRHCGSPLIPRPEDA